VSARDGGICRVKLPCGQLSSAQAFAVAAAARRHAGGVIELTNRANLQLRGVREERQHALIETLLAAGLGARTPGGDDVRNLMVSPALGIDPDSLLEVAPLAENILASLQAQARFQQLSPKFALLLDGGESAAMLDHPHDLWLSALAGDEPRFVFGLAGCPPRSGAERGAVAVVPAAHALALVEAVLHVFLDGAQPQQTRMRHLLQTLPPERFVQQVQQRLPCRLSPVPEGWRRRRVQAGAPLGLRPQMQPGLCSVGAMPALGRLRVEQWSALAQLAADHGDGTLRLTPWQGVLLPNIARASAPGVLQTARALGLTVEPGDPLARMIACSGAAGCGKGLADTKADALRLARLLMAENAAPVDVHLSGCARSCAAPHIASFTLLAVADGRYDLYRRDEHRPGFGELMASHVDIEHACLLLR